jgi:predicted flap endonuclease-1-like 5' DNA nuclease
VAKATGHHGLHTTEEMTTLTMHGFLWLILQMTTLLLAAALVFFWLGWRWRGQNAGVQTASLNESIDAESGAAERARQEKQAVQEALAQQVITANRDAAELLEAREHQRRLEREVLRLSEELKAAKRLAEPAPAAPKPIATDPPPAPAKASQPANKPAPAPATPATAPATPATAPATPATAPATPVPSLAAPAAPEALKAKAKRPASRELKGAPRQNAREVLETLEAKISRQQVLVGALNQEREGWQQRMDSLQGKAATDPAGFALTNKNLARSETQYREAIAALKSLQRQAAALERSLAVEAPAEGDDLTQIKGIKEALDQQLRAFGIHTYRQIALMSAEDLQSFSELLAFKNRAQRDGWQRQARELHKAKYGAEPS